MGKFDVILCDPPWQEYEKRARKANKYNQRPEYYKCSLVFLFSMDFGADAEIESGGNCIRSIIFISMGGMRAFRRCPRVNESMGVQEM